MKYLYSRISHCNMDSVIELNDGTILPNIDTIIYATGYKTTFPFLDEVDNIIKVDDSIETNYFGPLYKHMISIYHPEILFPRIRLQTLFSWQMIERKAI